MRAPQAIMTSRLVCQHPAPSSQVLPSDSCEGPMRSLTSLHDFTVCMVWLAEYKCVTLV